MPIYDITCLICGHQWEARIYKTSDEESELTCHECGEMAGDDSKDVTGTSFRMGPGFAARNGYGLKKFDDGKG